MQNMGWINNWSNLSWKFVEIQIYGLNFQVECLKYDGNTPSDEWEICIYWIIWEITILKCRNVEWKYAKFNWVAAMLMHTSSISRIEIIS